MSFDTIVYHDNCPDGWCAAFVLSVKFPGAQLVPAKYQRFVDESAIKDKDVMVVDFSWSRAETVRLHDMAKSMVVLDHHKTAEAELADLNWCMFDMERSGAQLAWDWAYGGKRPWYVDYVADRDLWRWSLPLSRQVNAYLMVLPYEMAAWSTLGSMSVAQAAELGVGARAQIEHYVRLVCDESVPAAWRGRIVHVVNAPYVSISDVGNQLCADGAEIGVGWFVRGDRRMQFSLRSVGDLDVSELAKDFGGGGHRNAAGFELSIAEGLSLLNAWGIS